MSKNFVIYKSSAGSGKTFTLVKEYLKIALSDKQNPPILYRQILAITFTNKAAAEMKERILKTLKELSEARSPVMEALLEKELQLNKEEIKKRAGLLLYDILHNYGNFAISTIDSFTHNIIRNFAHDLHLPVNFNIETDEAEIISKCIDELISRIGSDEAITKLIVDFSRSKTDEQKSWKVDEEIKNFTAKVLLNADSDRSQSLRKLSIEDFNEIKKLLQERNKTFEEPLVEIGNEFFLLLKKNHLEVKDIYRTNSGICGYFRKLASKDFANDSLFGSYVMETINDSKWYTEKLDEQKKTAIDGIKNKLENSFHQSKSLIEEGLGQYIIRNSILKDIYSLSLLNELDKIIHEFKDDENILFISEFNQRISDVISKEPVPFIYEKIGERYKHFLLDEFQDTSAMQWQNLLPLIDNSLAEGHFNLIVGDGKQSIYRWRGGEAEQFDSLPSLPLVKDNDNKLFWEETLQRNAEVKELSHNYRSLKNVIEFNNEFFNWIRDAYLNEKWQNIYRSVSQQVKEGNNGGLVSVDFISKDAAEDTNLELCTQYINNSLEAGYKYKDIVILIRNNYEGNLIADHLSKLGIPVISSDSLLLKNCEEVQLLLHLLSFLSTPDNAIAASAVINYLCDHGTLVQHDKSEYLLQLNKGKLKENFRDLLASESIRFNADELLGTPLLECTIKLIELFNIDHNKDYIQFFLDEIISFTARNTNSINAFMEWWEKKSKNSSLQIPEGSDAIKIMTIHKSKGLEFPVVIMPFCNWNTEKAEYIWIEPKEGIESALIKPNNDLLKTEFAGAVEDEKQKRLLDNINLLYVAFTRAANHLHIISRAPKKAGNTYDFIRRFAKEIKQLPEDETHFSIGEPYACNEKEEKENGFPYELQLKNWNNSVVIKSNYELSSKKTDTGREYGVLMHSIFSKIRKSSDVDQAIEDSVNEGLINKEQETELKHEITAIINNKGVSVFFEEGNEILNETEILSKEGNVLRPDRIILKENETIIVDFKTGKHSDEYFSQLESYANALREMGYKNCRKYLVYLNDKSVVECE